MGCGCASHQQYFPACGCSCWCPCRQSVLKGPASTLPYHDVHNASAVRMSVVTFFIHLWATPGLAFMYSEPLMMFQVLLAFAGGPSLSLWKIVVPVGLPATWDSPPVSREAKRSERSPGGGEPKSYSHSSRLQS